MARRVASLETLAEMRSGTLGRADLLENVFGEAVRALYAESESGRPDLVGSGVLFEWLGQYFLLTAGHVFVALHGRELWIAGEEEFVSVNNSRFYTADSKDEVRPGNPRLDAGFAELTAREVAALGAVRFLAIDELDPNHQPKRHAAHLGLGFPIKKSRLEPESRLAAASLARVSGFSSRGALTKLEYPEQFHFAIQFDRKRTLVDGRRATPPKPHGMSGGGLWHFPTYFGERSQPQQAKLVGILIETHERAVKCMVATRIGVFLDLLEAENKQLRGRGPVRRLGKVDAQYVAV